MQKEDSKEIKRRRDVRLIFMRFLREIPDYEIIELYNNLPHEEN